MTTPEFDAGSFHEPTRPQVSRIGLEGGTRRESIPSVLVNVQNVQNVHY